MAGKPWTDEDDAFMLANYSSMTAAELAEKLGRTPSAVFQRATRCGLAKVRDGKEIARRDEKITQLHAKGWSASEMQETVGIQTRSINKRLTVLGLKPHGRSERYKRRVAKVTQKQCEAAGVHNLGELRALQMKRVARNLGWPDHLSLRSVQILETLYQRGPMTRRQIADAIGVQWRGSRRTFSTRRAPGGSYMAELQRAGLVIRLKKAIKGKGKGRSHDLYMVALEVEPCREKREHYQSQKSSDRLTQTQQPSPCRAS